MNPRPLCHEACAQPLPLEFETCYFVLNRWQYFFLTDGLDAQTFDKKSSGADLGDVEARHEDVGLQPVGVDAQLAREPRRARDQEPGSLSRKADSRHCSAASH